MVNEAYVLDSSGMKLEFHSTFSTGVSSSLQHTKVLHSIDEFGQISLV